MSEIQKPRWYVVDKDGFACLCADEAEARERVDMMERLRHTQSPHIAVQMIEATPEWRAAVLAAADHWAHRLPVFMWRRVGGGYKACAGRVRGPMRDPECLRGRRASRQPPVRC